MRWATTWERERERERVCVCFFKPSTYDFSKTLDVRRKKERRWRHLVFGLGLVQMTKGDTAEEGPFPHSVASWNLGGCCLPFLFWLVLWPCTHLDSLSHPLFINLPITILCGFWIPNLSSSMYTYIYICYNCHRVY